MPEQQVQRGVMTDQEKTNMALVTARNLSKDYITGEITVKAIRGIDFTIELARVLCST